MKQATGREEYATHHSPGKHTEVALLDAAGSTEEELQVSSLRKPAECAKYILQALAKMIADESGDPVSVANATSEYKERTQDHATVAMMQFIEFSRKA